MIGFKTSLKQYSGRKIERLSQLPEFRKLVEDYGNIMEASEEELMDARRQTHTCDVAEALGLKELNDLGRYCH
tara:strand:- start:2169 stop:2387 length:219 start_codon:yes stop_codon:yes gene_type:complete